MRLRLGEGGETTECGKQRQAAPPAGHGPHMEDRGGTRLPRRGLRLGWEAQTLTLGQRIPSQPVTPACLPGLWEHPAQFSVFLFQKPFLGLFPSAKPFDTSHSHDLNCHMGVEFDNHPLHRGSSRATHNSSLTPLLSLELIGPAPAIPLMSTLSPPPPSPASPM